MQIGKTLYAANRESWRLWLSTNHNKEKEIWLVYYRKSSGKPRIPYNDAVEEALCYGWIDSTIKSIDSEKFAQRFTPRNPRSKISEMNKERIRKLMRYGKMTSAGLSAVARVFNPEKAAEQFIIASDILKTLRVNEQAWQNFQNFPEGYQRVRVGYLESRRRHGKELFQKSLKYFIKMTEKNKRFGFVRD
ncbi:MAG: YdeI/OmpD-associated family protein [archaeon]